MTRTALSATLAALTLAALFTTTSPATARAQLAPVMCSESDTTTDGRVFPEPANSTSFVTFEEFRCGVEFLSQRHPTLLDVKVVGRSAGDLPIYDVLMTDESVDSPKRKLLVVSSIHGNEVGGREGAVRQMEDMVDPELLGDEAWVEEVLDRYVIHWLFPNPDGWAGGDGPGATTRGNVNGTDLNRVFPVKGYINTANKPLGEPEGRAVLDELLRESGWYLGTDNHGQGPDTYAAAGLQIVGQFDYQKSETLARFADGIDEEMRNYGVLDTLGELKDATGQDVGAYHWGTLYDMLGYSASGSLIDYYNTASGNDGWGFATELTVGVTPNSSTYMPLQNEVWVNSVRAINTTMFKQAIDPKEFTFEVKGRAAYVFDPEVVTNDDRGGAGYEGSPDEGENFEQQDYRVTRMRFFRDLNRQADRPLAKLRVRSIVGNRAELKRFDSLVLANDTMPERAPRQRYYRVLKRWVRRGGNLILTDAALKALPQLGIVEHDAITVERHYVGSVEEFTDRSHHLNRNLRGVASQTYDTVPIGYSFGEEDTAPNWKVDQGAWEEAGGFTAGTNGETSAIYGEIEAGKGRIRILGALLPDPTEEYYHPFGLQNYAVTYTGYTLLQNMLDWSNPARG